MAYIQHICVLPAASMWKEVLLQRAAHEREAELLNVVTKNKVQIGGFPGCTQ